MYKLISIFLLYNLSLHSQNTDDSNDSRLYSISISQQRGKIIESNRFISGVNFKEEPLSKFSATSISISTQTKGDYFWEQFYNYPKYGFGLSYYQLGNREEIGNPISIFGNFSAPFKRWDKFSIEYELGLGLAFNWNEYSESNSYNISIGSNFTLHSNFGIKFTYRPLNRISISSSIELSHFSNGSIKTPNYGINMIAPKFELSYNLNYSKPDFKEVEVPEFISKYEILISPFFALKSISYKELGVSKNNAGVSFPIYGATILFNKSISHLTKIGIGTNLSYDESLNIHAIDDNGTITIHFGNTKENFTVSMIASFEMVFGRFSTLFQPSFYVYRESTYSQDIVFHQRIGIKYKINNRFFALCALRSNKFKEADYVEWTLAYKLI